MSVQDKLERILREMHIMVSRGAVWQENEDFVLIHKKQMQKELNSLSLVVNEMMEAYEVTEQSRNRGELEAEKHRVEIVRNANRQAEDIYAASVLYTDDALGRIGDIIEEAEKSMKEVWNGFNREIQEEKRLVRSNQLELKTQLEDLKDTAKYIKIIEERNREIAKAKAKKQQDAASKRYERKVEEDPEFVPITPEIKINEEYFEKAGLTPDGLPIENMEDEPKVYEKPEIKINEEYFKKAGIPLEKPAEDDESAEDAAGDAATASQPGTMEGDVAIADQPGAMASDVVTADQQDITLGDASTLGQLGATSDDASTLGQPDATTVETATASQQREISDEIPDELADDMAIERQQETVASLSANPAIQSPQQETAQGSAREPQLETFPDEVFEPQFETSQAVLDEVEMEIAQAAKAAMESEEFYDPQPMQPQEEMQESTSAEFAGEITPELEEQWMQELDMEYFEWRNKDTEKGEKKEKRRGLFGRRNRS